MLTLTSWEIVVRPLRTDSLQPSDWEYAPFGLELGFRTDWQQARRAAWWLLDEKAVGGYIRIRGRRIQRCQGCADRPYSLDRKFEAPPFINS